MITYFDSRYLVNLSYRGVQVYGRPFATQQDARAWEQAAYDAIDSGQPLPDERDPKYSLRTQLQQKYGTVERGVDK